MRAEPLDMAVRSVCRVIMNIFVGNGSHFCGCGSGVAGYSREMNVCAERDWIWLGFGWGAGSWMWGFSSWYCGVRVGEVGVVGWVWMMLMQAERRRRMVVGIIVC